MITDKTIIGKVEEALEQLRPFLEEDGGDMTLKEITDDFIVRLELHGACKTCSMSHMTLKAGVEEALKKAIPKLKKVEAVLPAKSETPSLN